MIKVAVCGAYGKMGKEICNAVEENEKTPDEEIIDDVNKEIEEITPPNVDENTQKGDEEK